MNNPLTIVVMIALACWPVPVHSQSQPQPGPVQAQPKPPEPSFEQRWQPEPMNPLPGEIAARMNPVKTFRVTRQVEGMIPGAASILPTHAFVRDETTSNLEPRQDVPVHVNDPAPLPREHPKARTIRKASLDICQRHGMVKRITRGGKSWRCQR